VPSLNDLVRQRTALTEDDLEWLHLLVADWQLLADLSFADLVLWVPTVEGARYVAVAQMRPTTGPTAYLDDIVGTEVRRGSRPMIDAALDEGRIVREGDPEWRNDVPVRVEAIPVRRRDAILAVIGRNTNLIGVRTPSRLELTYLQCATDLARMIAEGRFPQRDAQVDLEASPRVGDGLLRLDAAGIVSYASPNALSAFRRLGYAGDLLGAHLGRTIATLAPVAGPVDEAVEVVASGRAPRKIEVEANEAFVQLRAIPLTPEGDRAGALVLAHDVTELRRRERELLTKDATIREIHHRVKNNLQTVAALLRLQARRLGEASARSALEEAVRRVGSIAIVHETLSMSADEEVAFDQIAHRILAMVAEVSGAEVGVEVVMNGGFGMLGSDAATPLAMVLTELAQNSFEHGLGQRSGKLEVSAARSVGRLRMVVADDGCGLPQDFDPDASGKLGLQIVRTLVVGELGGQLEMGERPGGGTRVIVDLPLRPSLSATEARQEQADSHERPALAEGQARPEPAESHVWPASAQTQP
jgi:two-component system, sensor histidine kinase PdtaS